MFSFFIFFFLPLNLRDETTTTISKSATDKTWAINVLYAPFVINPYREFNQLTCPLTASSKDNMIIWGTFSLCKFPGMSVLLHRQSGSLQTSGEHGWAGPRLRRFTAAPVVPVIITQNRSKANATFAGRFIILLGFWFCGAFLCFKWNSSSTQNKKKQALTCAIYICRKMPWFVPLFPGKLPWGKIYARGDVTLRSFRKVSVGR